MRTGLHLLFSLILISTACAPPKSPKSNSGDTTFSDVDTTMDGKPRFESETNFVSADWEPSAVEVTCAAEKCPLQIGALLFVGATVNNQIPIRRCTAFLVSNDVVMSNAHCDGFGKEKGYFVSQRINGQKQIREIVAVPFKRFTPHPDGTELSSGRPDVALFSLNQPLNGIPALRLASGPQLRFNKLITFAVFNNPSKGLLTVEKRECQVHRHESEFPFEIVESPDMITSYGCRMEPGTSGSPMFAPGSEEVQAVHVSATDPGKRAQAVREKYKRDLFIYEKHWSSQATNVRCLDLPGVKPAACAITDRAALKRRFDDVQSAEHEKLRLRRLLPVDAPVRLAAAPFLLAPQQDLHFEVIHTPECRNTQEMPGAVQIIIEHAKIQFDEWATPNTQSLSQTILNPEVRSSSQNGLEIEVSWPSPLGTYMHPELDLRKKWGNRFSIALPMCPR